MNYRELMNQYLTKGTIEQVKLPRGLTEGFVKSEPLDGPSKLPKREQLGRDYAIKYKIQEEQQQQAAESSQLEEPDGLTSIAGTLPNTDDIYSDQLTQVYDIYTFSKKHESSLIIHNHKEEILENIESNAVVLIKGQTGCGKSTQVPQMILDNAAQANVHCSIVVTQPRRIATISVAKRVANERGWGLGTIVGYQIALDKKISKDTRLLFCTTGVLLQQLILAQSLSKYTHIIVDEIHERDMNTDFLLILIKLFLRNHSCRTRIILMSATANTEKFMEYFTRRTRGCLIEPPIIEMSKGLTNYLVSIYYLDDLKTAKMPMKIPDVKYDDPCITSASFEMAASLVEVFHTIDLYEHVDKFLGSVLIFLPGIFEIEGMYDCLKKREANRKNGEETWWVCPLHRSVTFDEQISVFKPAPPNCRKIILATNIAESSITVPDVKYVIDFCLMKYQKQETDSGFTSLQTSWMSKSQGTQRAGRVGRVMPGRVYRLIPNSLYQMLDDDCEPELMRSPLDVLVLKAKQLSDTSPPSKILAFALDPPDLSNIIRTVLNLKQAGALMVTRNGEYAEDDGDLTYIGQVMATLPLSIQLTKLILMGHKFSLLKDAIIIACAMDVRSVFSTPFRQQLEAYNSKIAWGDSSCSDPITFKIVYEIWKHKTSAGFYNRSGGLNEYDLAKRYFIQIKSLQEVRRLEEEVTKRLIQLNITEDINSSVRWTDMEKPLILKIMIAGAFYPNYFIRRPVDEKEAVKILGGKDPFNTCYLSGFPMGQPGPLYADAIKNYFTHCGSDINVSFDGSSKVYLEFKSSATDIDSTDKPAMMPGYIQMALYRAIKLRQLKKFVSIPLLPASEAKRRWNSLAGGSGEFADDAQRMWNKQSPKIRSHLPGYTTQILTVSITHKENPNKFWIQIVDETIYKRLLWIHKLLNDSNRAGLVPLTKPLQTGMLVAAPYSDNKKGPSDYYRAKIRTIGVGNSVQVFFIDFGNVEWVDSKHLRDFHQNLVEQNIPEEPEIAMECTLTEVQPSVMANRNGLWSQAAMNEFDRYFGPNHAIAKIYSVVNGVVSVILFGDPGPHFKLDSLDFGNSFNYHLIKKGFADRCEEPYLSRENSILREMATKRPDLVPAFSSPRSSDTTYVESPKASECTERVVLKGPKSPLEMQLCCMTQKSITKEVVVEWNSVNSVLLDTYPMDSHERLLVAGLVTQNPTGDRLILRQTTLMPNIHGLFAVIALIFAPSVELRVDSERTRWTGAICGLGCNPITNQPYDPENDMEINFDVAFTLDDLENINKLRYWMNQIVFGGMDWQKELSKGNVLIAHIKIKELITKLLLKKRPSQGISGYAQHFKWGVVDDKWLMSPVDGDEPVQPSLYPLIWAVSLRKSSMLVYAELAKSLNKLQLIAQGLEQVRTSVQCELCHVHLDDVQAVKFHLSSTMHREANFEYNKNINE